MFSVCVFVCVCESQRHTEETFHPVVVLHRCILLAALSVLLLASAPQCSVFVTIPLTSLLIIISTITISISYCTFHHHC